MDINHGGAALLIGLLLSHDQPMVYITGLAVHQASTAYRGQGKTDEKDAFVIADQARMRQDLGLLRPGDEIAVDLRTLTGRRLDLVNDRTRQTNRLRAQLLEFFPALERALNLSKKGPVMLLTGYQTPAAIRRSGARRIGTWLKNRKVKNAAALAETAVEAARPSTPHCPERPSRPPWSPASPRACWLSTRRSPNSTRSSRPGFSEHRHAEVIRSLPGMGTLLGAEFIAATGGDMEAFGTADRLASFAGLSPSATGLRPRQRQHAPPTPLPPRPAPGLLPLRDGQPENLSPPPRLTTDASGTRARGTSRPCSPSPVDEPTSCGP